jgi:N-acetylglucosamine repressor
MVAVGEPKLHREVGNADGRRRYNRALILELIRTRGPVSKTELARRGALKLPVVAEIVDALVEEGMIGESGVGPSTGGRRPLLYSLRPRARCAVGINVGTQSLTAVVTDLNAEVERRLKVPSLMSRGPEALGAQVTNTLRELLDGLPATLGERLGIGVALPAPVLTSCGPAFSPPSYPGWGELDVGGLVERELGLPVLLDNDANAAALGEHLYGAGRGIRDMFYLIVHRGVGGAAILDGILHRGARGGAGEIGHSLIEIDGPRCGCGKFGCLEAFAGRAAIARRATRAMKLAGGATIAGHPAEEVTTQDVISAGLSGDPLAAEILAETGRYLGLGISNAINAYDPELVVVGGSTLQAGNLVLAPAIEVVRRRAMAGMAEEVRIVPGELGEDAGAIGAAALVLRSVFAVSVVAEEV